MKPFDLEKAKAGHPVCTAGGQQVRIVCFDKTSRQNCPIIGLVKLYDDAEKCIFYSEEGWENGDKNSRFNLRMASEKYTQYAIVDVTRYPVKAVGLTLFSSIEEARTYAKGNPIATVTWEE